MTFENKIRRNITATFQSPDNWDGWDGAMYETDTYVSGPSGGGNDRMAKFDASRVVSTSTENRPYSIFALPLIAF